MQITLLIVAIFLMGSGHGSHMGFTIFYGWFTTPFFDPLYDYFFAIIPAMFFIFALIILIGAYYGIIGKRLLQIIIVIHFIGVIISCIFHERNLSYISYNTHIIGATISIFVSYFFWKIFFEVIKKVKQKDTRLVLLSD